MATIQFELLEGHQWPTYRPLSDLSEKFIQNRTKDFYAEWAQRLWGWCEDAQIVSGESFAERDIEDLLKSALKARGVKVELTKYEAFHEEGCSSNRRFKLVVRGNGWTHIALVFFEIENATVHGLSDDDDGRPADDLRSIGLRIGFDAVDEKSMIKMGEYFHKAQAKLREAE